MKKTLLLICFAMVSVFVQAQWTLQNSLPTSNTLNSIHFPDANTGYAVGANGTIIKTIDGGTSWDTLSSGTNYAFNSVFFTDANTGYAVSEYSTILKTTDGGATWTTSWHINYYLSTVFFTQVNTGYVVGGDWGNVAIIIKTNDGGTTWDSVFSTTAHSFSSIYFTDTNTGYALGSLVGGEGIISKTNDGGTTWTELSIGSAYYSKSVFFTDANTGYGVGGDGFSAKILKTIDGGAIWTTYTFPGETMAYLNSVYFTDANTGYAVGGHSFCFLDCIHSQLILKTIDGGKTWIELSSGTNANLKSVFFTDANTGYAVGTGGTILKTTNGGGLVSIKETQTPQSTFTIYPNPATNRITITTTGKSQEETRVSIFSLNGRLIQRDKFQNIDRFEMDVSNVAKGIYLLKIQSAEGVETQKLVLQ